MRYIEVKGGRMKYKNICKLVEEGYHFYLQSKKLDQLIYIIYKIFSKELRYYHNDQELIDNFILEFIEKKLMNVIENYQKKFDNVKNNFSFTSYFVASIKKAFFSYKQRYRIEKKWELMNICNLDIINLILDKENRFINLYNSHDDFWFIILESINKFPLIERVIFKLFYDFKLNLEELQYLVKNYGYEKTKSFLNMYYHKKEQINDKNNSIEQNSNKFYIENLISKYQDDIDKQYKILRYNLYKKRKSSKTLPSAKLIGKFLNFKNYKIYNQLYKIRKKIIYALNSKKQMIHEIYQCA